MICQKLSICLEKYDSICKKNIDKAKLNWSSINMIAYY